MLGHHGCSKDAGCSFRHPEEVVLEVKIFSPILTSHFMFTLEAPGFETSLCGEARKHNGGNASPSLIEVPSCSPCSVEMSSRHSALQVLTMTPWVQRLAARACIIVPSPCTVGTVSMRTSSCCTGSTNCKPLGAEET